VCVCVCVCDLVDMLDKYRGHIIILVNKKEVN